VRYDIVLKKMAAGWEVSVVDPRTGLDFVDPDTQAPLLAKPHQLGCKGAGRAAFPLPDPAVLAQAPADVPGALCAPVDDEVLASALSELLNQGNAAGSVRLFGRYLFTVLLGETLWKRLDQHAKQEPIELALRWARDDSALNRLPWETLCSESGFLSQAPQVSITRRVTAPVQPIVPSDSTPCVLFVVGSPLSDRAIKPGAEYLGLLRALNSNGLYLDSHLLLNASIEKLQAAVKSFRPQVVHFICHGVAQGDQVKLQLVDDRNPKLTVEVACQSLVQSLKTDRGLPLPQAVVLNACATATNDELESGRPFAAELVEAGIPVVIGMSGHVADQACRMFSKGFYRALLAGEDVAVATAAGRRAAISFGGYDPKSKVDWALPVIFLAESLTEARLSTGAVGFGQVLHTLASKVAPPAYPGFCGRFELLQDFSLFMGSAENQRSAFGEPKLVFAVSSPDADGKNDESYPRYGRTWLLQELAARAFRAGHLPCVMDRPLAGGNTWPTTPEALALTLLRAVKNSVQLLRAQPHFQTLLWNAPALMAVSDWFKAGPGPIPPTLPAEVTDLRLDDDDFSRRFATAFRLDLASLIEAVRPFYPENMRRNLRIVLLIDDVHRMSDAAAILLSTFLGLDGIAGTPADDFRAVVTYAEKPSENQQSTVKTIEDWRGAAHGVHSGHLEPFSRIVDFEQGDRLPYKQFLLGWQEPQPGTKQRTPRPLTVALAERANPQLDYFFEALAETCEGVPSMLATERAITVLVQKGVGKFLQVATDEDALQAESLKRRP
jgi:hypothetical protein